MSRLPTDGRDLDPRLADAGGIAAGQRAHPDGPDRPMPGAGAPVWSEVSGPRDTYYDQPVVKAPPWGPKVAAYIVLGGVAGTAATVAAAADLAGGPALAGLARRARPLAAIAGASGAGLLAADLGRPGRALHMMRVLKPTSVMNLGGYLLGATSGLAALSVVGPHAARRPAGLVAGVTGIPLAGYTGVLLGATAIPGWNAGLRTLPPLFLASGAASTASLLRLAPGGPAAEATLTTLAVAAQAGELAAEAALERTISGRPHTRAAYAAEPGWRAGRLLTVASLALAMVPQRRRRGVRLISAGLGLAGSVATKVAVFHAGMRSAGDARAVAETTPS